MPRYEVTLSQWTRRFQVATVEVEAESEEAAKTTAFLNVGPFDWDMVDMDEDTIVTEAVAKLSES